MLADNGNSKSTEAIRSRAEEIAAAGEPLPVESELLAAIEDGVFSFEEMDEDDL